MPMTSLERRKQDIAGLILIWIEENEARGTITLKGVLNIAVLAARISRL